MIPLSTSANQAINHGIIIGCEFPDLIAACKFGHRCKRIFDNVGCVFSWIRKVRECNTDTLVYKVNHCKNTLHYAFKLKVLEVNVIY